MFNKNNPRLNDEYAQLFNQIVENDHYIGPGRPHPFFNRKNTMDDANWSATPLEAEYVNEWVDNCTDPEPSPRLKQLYSQLTSEN